MSEVTQDHLMTDHPMTDPPMPMTEPPMPMTEPPMPMTEPPAMEIDQKPPVEEQREEPGAPKAPPPETGAGAPAVRSIEGWIVLVTNVHEEASEEDLQERFGEYGDIQNLHLNLDRRTGYVKGYALIEYSTLAEAREAIAQTDNTKLLDQTIYTDYAFVRPPPVHNNANRGGGRASGGYNKRGGRGSGDRGGRSSARSRSRSPVAAKEDDAEEPTPIILESLGDQVG